MFRMFNEYLSLDTMEKIKDHPRAKTRAKAVNSDNLDIAQQTDFMNLCMPDVRIYHEVFFTKPISSIRVS